MHSSAPVMQLDKGAIVGIGPAAAEALAVLLSAATTNLDIDRAQAKDCIARAVTLLRNQGEWRQGHAPGVNAPRGGLTPWQAHRITEYISTHLADKIQAEDLADLAMVSTGHFFRAFRETFGEAPMLFVARQRMRYAQQLILTSREPLSQVALACGFSDQAHFTRVFRRIVGCSPLSWRREYSEGPLQC